MSRQTARDRVIASLTRRGFAIPEWILEWKPKSVPKWLRTVQHRGPHHIIPSSRGGPSAEWNLFSGKAGDRFWQPEDQWICHPAYHFLAANCLPSEFIALLEKWSAMPQRAWYGDFSPRQRDAWDLLFGPVSPQEVTVWIERHFLPAEQRFQEGATRRRKGKEKKHDS